MCSIVLTRLHVQKLLLTSVFKTENAFRLVHPQVLATMRIPALPQRGVWWAG